MLMEIEKLDLSLQTRAGTDAETIDAYAQLMREGVRFPDVTCFTDGKAIWLADGFHRVMAAKQCGKKCINAMVRNGDENAAVIWGGTANNKQGKRPTRADVEHFMRMAWERRNAIFHGTPTGGFFAEICGVSKRSGENFVQARLDEMRMAEEAARAQLAHVNDGGNGGKLPPMPVRLVGRDGKQYPARNRPQAGDFHDAGDTGRRGKCRHADAAGYCTTGNGAGSRCCKCAGYEPEGKPNGWTDGAAWERNGGTDGGDPRTPHGWSGAEGGDEGAPKERQIWRDKDGGVHYLPLDCYDVEMVPEIAAAINGDDGLRDALGLISKARCQLRYGIESKDPAFAALKQDALIMLDNSYNWVKAALPHCVCRMCQGNGCQACHDRGWQTADEYERNPREFKAE